MVENNKETCDLYSNEYYDFLKCAYKRRYEQNEPWSSIKEDFNSLFNTNITGDSLRKRSRNFVVKNKCEIKVNNNNCSKQNNETNNFNNRSEFVSLDSNGILTAQKIIECSQESFSDTRQLLKKLGYDPSVWEVLNMRISAWEQNSKDGVLKNLNAVNFKLKKRDIMSIEDVVEAIKEASIENAKPFKVQYEINGDKTLDDNKLMEICPIELHLGKLANEIDTGENYNSKKAKKIFEYIIKEICKKQAVRKCGKALVVIGSDFFNSEPDNMTTAKTPQQNDGSYKQLYIIGRELYVQALLTLRELFNDIEVRVCAGNHARSMEFFLYSNLKDYFRDDDVIHFSDDYKDTQAIQFGDCAIFYNHGDANLKRTIDSIPAEFHKIWGQTKYRELHLGHLHKETAVDDNGGMITRRIGSPCGIDKWHYENRFCGAVRKHQVFIWNANGGLESNEFINIDDSFFK